VEQGAATAGTTLGRSDLWLVVVALAAALLLLARLGALDLWAPDEPRYAQVAEEVRALDDGPAGLVLLSLNDQVYDQKPPLYYWLAALAGAPGGRVTEAAARLPSALAGVATVVLVMLLGRSLFSAPRTAALAGALLLTTWLFCHLGRRVQLDVLLTLFETAALAFFWRFDRGLGRPRLQVLAMHAALGLAVLTKGPVGFVVPALVIVAYLAFEGRLGQWRSAFPLRGLALSLLPVLAWLGAAIALAPAGYFDSAVVDNLYGRFVEGTSKQRPWHYFLYVFPADGLPWTLLWPLAAWVGWRQVFTGDAEPGRRRAWRFLLAWVVVPFVFFSLSSGKRGLYLLPSIPAVSLLLADACVRTLAGAGALPRSTGVALAGLGALLVLAAWFFALVPVFPQVDIPVVLALAVTTAVALPAWAFRRAGTSAGALGQLAVLVAAVLAIELSVFTLLLPALDPQKSPRPIAVEAARWVGPGERIGLLGERPFTGGLVYYSGHPVARLDDPAALSRFFEEEDGGAAVMTAAALGGARAATPVEVRARFRSGRREMLVVTPAPEGAAPDAPSPAAAPVPTP